jgi:hypothetical protein
MSRRRHNIKEAEISMHIALRSRLQDDVLRLQAELRMSRQLGAHDRKRLDDAKMVGDLMHKMLNPLVEYDAREVFATRKAWQGLFHDPIPDSKS